MRSKYHSRLAYCIKSKDINVVALCIVMLILPTAIMSGLQAINSTFHLERGKSIVESRYACDLHVESKNGGKKVVVTLANEGQCIENGGRQVTSTSFVWLSLGIQQSGGRTRWDAPSLLSVARPTVHLALDFPFRRIASSNAKKP
jgi:hypothetical protein